MAIGVVLALRGHRTVKGEVRGGDRTGGAQIGEELVGNPGEVGRGDRTPGGDSPCSERRDHLDPRSLREHIECPGDLTAVAAVVGEHPVAAVYEEIVVPRRERVERTHFVDALGNDNTRSG